MISFDVHPLFFCRTDEKGKNWYICIDDDITTVNACSDTIIMAHKKKLQNMEMRIV